jgi:hypothetical protein
VKNGESVDAVARPRDDRQKDLLRLALEAIIDLGHPLVRLAREIDWGFLGSAPPVAPRPGADANASATNVRQAVAEAQLAAEELVIGVLQPARTQHLVRQVVHVPIGALPASARRVRASPACRPGWWRGCSS